MNKIELIPFHPQTPATAAGGSSNHDGDNNRPPLVATDSQDEPHHFTSSEIIALLNIQLVRARSSRRLHPES